MLSDCASVAICAQRLDCPMAQVSAEGTRVPTRFMYTAENLRSDNSCVPYSRILRASHAQGTGSSPTPHPTQREHRSGFRNQCQKGVGPTDHRTDRYI